MNNMNERLIWLFFIAIIFTSCRVEDFTRTAGNLPNEPGSLPFGALYLEGTYDVVDMQDFSISKDTVINLVYRLDYPTVTDVVVALSLGTQEDIDDINDALGLKDNFGDMSDITPYERYRIVSEGNYELPSQLLLTIPAGKTESDPFSVNIYYDEGLLQTPEVNHGLSGQMWWPLMLPLIVTSVEGDVRVESGQIVGIGIKAANLFVAIDEIGETITLEERDENITFLTFCDCRTYNPFFACYYYYAKDYYVKKTRPNGRNYWMLDKRKTSRMFDVEVVRPAFVVTDPVSTVARIDIDQDLMYVLTHSNRYLNPQKKAGMKVCLGVETTHKSTKGFCNLTAEDRESLVWEISHLLHKYDLDGVSFTDSATDYSVEGMNVDTSSYTLFLKELRDAIGDKLILVAYDADVNSALYESHDGICAGDYIDIAWWGTPNEVCNPYSDDALVPPIAGLPASKFAPLAGDWVDNEAYAACFKGSEAIPAYADVLNDLYVKGQCNALVYLGLRAYHQNFYEMIPPIPLRFCSVPFPVCVTNEDKLAQGEGYWAGVLLVDRAVTLGQNGYYDSGLKDW